MIVRARLKRLEDIPSWAVCCPLSRELVASQAGKEISVDTEDVAQIYMRCTCGQITPWVTVITVVDARVAIVGSGVVSDGAFNVVPIDCYDLDEGPPPR